MMTRCMCCSHAAKDHNVHGCMLDSCHCPSFERAADASTGPTRPGYQHSPATYVEGREAPRHGEPAFALVERCAQEAYEAWAFRNGGDMCIRWDEAGPNGSLRDDWRRIARAVLAAAGRGRDAQAERIRQLHGILDDVWWAMWCGTWPVVGRLLGDGDTAPLPCIHPFHECRDTRDRATEMETTLNALRWRLGLPEDATIQQIFAKAVSAIALNTRLADNK